MSLDGTDSAVVTKLQNESESRADSGQRFFVAMACIFVLITAVGFAPSFYLRNVPPIGTGYKDLADFPVYLVLHGVALTLWFLLFLVQTVLVQSRRVRVHQTLGKAGAILAVIVFTLSLFVVVRSVARSTSHGVPASELGIVVIGNFLIMVQFACYTASGIRFRRKPDVHRRFMYLASIGLLAPAIARWPSARFMFPLFIVLPQFALYLALIGYDIFSQKRLHRVTKLGLVIYVITLVVTVGLGSSDIGRNFVNMLK